MKDNQFLARRIIEILDIKAKKGVPAQSASWEGYTNGNGQEVGKDIEILISHAKRTLKVK